MSFAAQRDYRCTDDCGETKDWFDIPGKNRGEIEGKVWEDDPTDEGGGIPRRLWKAKEKSLQETGEEKGMNEDEEPSVKQIQFLAALNVAEGNQD